MLPTPASCMASSTLAVPVTFCSYVCSGRCTETPAYLKPGEVDDPADAVLAQRAVSRSRVEDRARDERDAVRHEASVPAGQVVEDDGAEPGRRERPHDVRADVAGAAGDQPSHAAETNDARDAPRLGRPRRLRAPPARHRWGRTGRKGCAAPPRLLPWPDAAAGCSLRGRYHRRGRRPRARGRDRGGRRRRRPARRGRRCPRPVLRPPLRHRAGPARAGPAARSGWFSSSSGVWVALRLSTEPAPWVAAVPSTGC